MLNNKILDEIIKNNKKVKFTLHLKVSKDKLEKSSCKYSYDNFNLKINKTNEFISIDTENEIIYTYEEIINYLNLLPVKGYYVNLKDFKYADYYGLEKKAYKTNLELHDTTFSDNIICIGINLIN